MISKLLTGGIDLPKLEHRVIAPTTELVTACRRQSVRCPRTADKIVGDGRIVSQCASLKCSGQKADRIGVVARRFDAENGLDLPPSRGPADMYDAIDCLCDRAARRPG
jgi:hypothetical protein